MTYLALNFRRDHKQLFQEGAYLPLDAHGYRREHVCGFARTLAGDTAVTVVPRLLVVLTEGVERLPLGPDIWKDTWLVLPKEEEGCRYRNLYTGELLTVTLRNRLAGLHLSEILKSFPVALLEKVAD